MEIESTNKPQGASKYTITFTSASEAAHELLSERSTPPHTHKMCQELIKALDPWLLAVGVTSQGG